MGMETSEVNKVTQMQMFGIRDVLASELVNGVLIVELQNASEAAPIYDLESGIELKGIDIRENGVSFFTNNTFGNGAFIRVRCSSGKATLVNEDPGTSSELRFKLSAGENIGVYCEPIDIMYLCSRGCWCVAAPYIKKPSLVSPSSAASVLAGLPIVYTAISDMTDSKWVMVDDGGTGVSIDYDTGVMSGGASAPAGQYNILIRAASVWGVSGVFPVSWTVNSL